MSLLLTKTCEYALLVTIQQGRHFNSNDQSIQVETELDLKLPSSINDLIPQNTKISTPSANIETDGTCTFNVSLVYFISTKQLIRLRKDKATTRIYIKNDHSLLNSFSLPISEAREVVPQSAHKLEHIYKFVADKGVWCSMPESQQELKIGLFYVAMPDTTKDIPTVTTPCIELRSPPPTPNLTSATVISTYSNNSSSSNNSTLTTSTANNSNNNNSRRKKVSSVILGSSSVKPKKRPEDTKRAKPKPTLRRTKSSLLDLNIEELSDMLRNVHIFTDDTKTPSSMIEPAQLQAYHQIGKGTLKYTLVFKVLHVDNISHTILRTNTSKRLKKPYISWTFLSTCNISPAASYVQEYNPVKSCFQLCGHLVDIQHWLDRLGPIKLSLLVMDKHTKQTAGTSSISLKDLAFKERPFDDRTCSIYNAQDESVAEVTVRVGLISGWHQDDSSLFEDGKRDPWDMIMMSSQQKKMRYSTPSSIPTLTTTSISTKSTQPTIHYVTPYIRSSSSSIMSYFNTNNAINNNKRRNK
ncbi:hypothetical protein BCV72DRAFT_68699 [Rhizopus microsporus var. microsporus]|uniref:Uncharacterized protein n=2 Tax=Rhizopus microsporus TaxID=58291 RepID=A0A1X0RB23_RHIZD|nr:hypothetical protein BCV72DRAFT_68699 [Rhizopus microsporus var. microsporus]